MTAAGTADNNDDIIVIGYRYDSGGMGEGGGGGGGLGDFQDPATSIQNPTDDGAPAQAEVALPTPCTETTFSAPGATTQEANQAALDASNAIAARNDETYEFSSLIYSLNGEVGWTAPFTNHDTQQVNWAGGIGGVPDGAIIIGVLHNHPDEPTITDTIPSGSGGLDGMDWDSYHELVDYNRDHTIDLPRGITVDQNLILYIYSNEDHKTHTYDLMKAKPLRVAPSNDGTRDVLILCRACACHAAARNFALSSACCVRVGTPNASALWFGHHRDQWIWRITVSTRHDYHQRKSRRREEAWPTDC